jgi:hypothetical protein
VAKLSMPKPSDTRIRVAAFTQMTNRPGDADCRFGDALMRYF